MQPDEARSLVDRFDVERDGHIRYRLFFFYALQHTRPCNTHGRVICGDCCYYGGCNKYTYVLANGNRSSLCCRLQVL